MSLLIPPSKNYQSPLITLNSRWESAPIEGARLIPVEIPWVEMGGTGQCVLLNLAGLGAQTFSQIVSLSVDNSQCGADIVFLFSDTSQTYTVPAYSPNDVFPVFTGQTQFYIKAIGELTAADVTRFAVHNNVPPPISIPVTDAQQTAALGSIAMTGAGVTPIVLPTVNGTMQNLSLSAAIPNPPATFNDAFTFTDGTGKVLATVNCAGLLNIGINALLLNLSNMSSRFRGGIVMTQSGGFNTGGTISVNLLYRMP
jgi:hypothetical protein